MENIDNMEGGNRGYYHSEAPIGRYAQRRNASLSRGGNNDRYSEHGGMGNDADGQISRKCMDLIDKELRKDPELGPANAITSVIKFHLPAGSDNCTFDRPNLRAAVRKQYDFDTNTLAPKRGGYNDYESYDGYDRYYNRGGYRDFYPEREYYPDSMHGGALGAFRNEIGIISLRDEILQINLD